MAGGTTVTTMGIVFDVFEVTLGTILVPLGTILGALSTLWGSWQAAVPPFWAFLEIWVISGHFGQRGFLVQESWTLFGYF